MLRGEQPETRTQTLGQQAKTKQGKCLLSRFQFALPVYQPDVSVKPLVDERRNARVPFPGVFSNCLGNLWLQINRQVQFGVRAEELPSFAFREVILFFHDCVSRYCWVSLLLALRAEMIRTLHSSSVTSENVWMRSRTLPCLSCPMVTQRSSPSLCFSSKIEIANGSRKTSAARSKLVLCFRKFSLALNGSQSKV